MVARKGRDAWSARTDVTGIPVSVLRRALKFKARWSRDDATLSPRRYPRPMSDFFSDGADPSRPIPPVEQPARLEALVEAVQGRTAITPRVGIVLGSGLGGLADELENPVVDPVRRAAGLARGDRAGPRRPAAARAPRPASRS